ncbi:Isoamylase 3 [Durusdinium trenchii]|uniref:Chloroplastic (AtISA3) n=1 Tax=Durusdinium trenchii TaxID=1381693 RepID=A0ABP0KXL2_9DINO
MVANLNLAYATVHEASVVEALLKARANVEARNHEGLRAADIALQASQGPKYSPMAVIPDRRAIYDFDWQGVKPPGLHLKDLVIYETHVRGFTRNPDSKLQDWDATAGTFLGFIQKIPHLLHMGINAVELLPVFEFDETACPRKNPKNGEQLCHFWGYSTVNFCVPMQRFSSRDRIGAAIVGFKTMVRELHRQGIEVILDVVFNHTAEGAWGEHYWHSWAAIAKHRYYILSHGQDTNYTGCGNTVNANDPMCSDWIVECLSYWVDEMHVDGFRFDLASALTRGNDGKVSMDPLLMRKMANEPKLKRAKFIAEAWDCSWPDGYLVGKFPSGGPPRWAEWNGIFRDTVRCFIKGDEGKKGDFATRICGSSDLFKHNGRKPYHSINFITAHDGFTLKDLVSYNGKHNTCNGENSGDDHNNSWNCGYEGETGDGGVKHLRNKQMRNFLVALFMSAGTPMILYGDEYGRSQWGCNNGWCQDTRCWFSWSDCEKEQDRLIRFTRLLISLRKNYSGIFNREEFVSNKDIWWRVHWDDPYNYICYVLHDHHATGQGYAGLLVAFNAGHEVRSCNLPEGKPWYRIIDTNLGPPDDICENEASAVRISSHSYVMQPYSCIVLKTFSDKLSIKEYAKSDAEYGADQDLNRHMKEIIKRRMSLEFTSSVAAPSLEDIGRRRSNEAMERMQSMVRMRSLMSGAFLDALDEGEGNEEKDFSFSPSPREAKAPTPVSKSPRAEPRAALPGKPVTGQTLYTGSTSFSSQAPHRLRDSNELDVS